MAEEQRSYPTMPALALRGLVVYPRMMVHFDVGREMSIKALEEAMSNNQPVFLVAQKDIRVEAPGRKQLFPMGTVSVVRQILRLPAKSVRVMVEGQYRARLKDLVQTEPYLVAAVDQAEIPASFEGKGTSLKAEASIRQSYELFDRYGDLSPKNNSADMLMNIMSSQDPGYIADFIAQNVSMRVVDKQSVLEELRPVQRLNKVNRLLYREVEILEMEQDIQHRVQENMSQNQKDAFLREQVRVLQEELGEDSDNEIAAYRRQIADAKLPEEVEDKLMKEVIHLEKQPFGSAEASVLRNYLDICLELPWSKKSKERINVEAARKILDADHFGLEDVKKRILEFLAVKQLAPDLKGQIICLVGPPGVGKTSIGMSMARAMNRKLARISLGGVHDEADIRGHRKTYVGAMPGRIINAIRQAGTKNPLLLLDEIDKLGSDLRGDPSAALLEVLDGEQNATFRDHFVELPFDLSDVVFVTSNVPHTTNHGMLFHHDTTDDVVGKIFFPSIQALHGQTVTKPDCWSQFRGACKTPEVGIIEIWQRDGVIRFEYITALLGSHNVFKVIAIRQYATHRRSRLAIGSTRHCFHLAFARDNPQHADTVC